MPKNPHADFSPVLDGYSGIGAFRFWCQTALPLTYDDSLSYYELLNKVINYLNHTIEDLTTVESNTSALAEAYNNLQKYVNDYFDDIDIEAELRNVLDAMAEDGTLDDLLDPLVENRLPGVVDEKIDGVVAEQIDGAVAGQIDGSVAEQLPALVSEGIPQEVSDWLDDNVNPVGSAVTIDKSLTIENSAADAKVTGNMIGNIEGEISGIMNKEYAELKYINGFDEKYVKYGDGGLTTTTSTYVTNYIDISKFSKIKYKRTGTTYATTQAGMAFYSDKNEASYISGVQAAISQSASGYVTDLYEVIVPYNAKYARFTVYKDTTTYGNFAVYGCLKDKILTGSKAVITNLSKGLISATNETLSDRNGCYSSRIILTGESVLAIKENAAGNVFFYDENNDYIGKISANGNVNKTAGSWFNLNGTINIKDYAPKNAISFKFSVSPTDGTVLTAENYIEWANSHYSLYTKKTFTPTKLRIATYNTGNFTGTGISQSNSTPYYKTAISKANCDVLATQEDVNTYASKDPYVSIYKPFFAIQQRINEDGANKFNCCSNQVLLEVTKHEFTTYNAHPYYVDYVFLIENKIIHIVNIHLDWYDKNMRATQISELLDYIGDFEYVIVIGDFNPFNYINGVPVDASNPTMYEEDFSIWTNAGYYIANGSSCGTFDTVVAVANGQWYPCDNIVTSQNIKIKYANVVSESWMNDHKILYADLDIL